MYLNIAVVTAFLMITSLLPQPSAQETAVPVATGEPQPHEPPGAGVRPPLPHGPRLTSPPLPRAALRVGSFESVQVNVDASGNNVLGDAANEPSIAVDPNNGARMAIGWREFQSVTSSFREAGVAYSTDAGVSWNNNGPLTPGTFRSDPVLRSNADGRFYYNSLASGDSSFCTDMFISGDGGRSWIGPLDAIGGDKAWLAIDRTNEVSRGSIYSAWNVGPFVTCEGTTVSRSLDGGITFEDFVVPSPARLRLGTVTVGTDGTFYVAGVINESTVPRIAFSSNISDPLVTNPTWMSPPARASGWQWNQRDRPDWAGLGCRGSFFGEHLRQHLHSLERRSPPAPPTAERCRRCISHTQRGRRLHLEHARAGQ